MGREPVSGRTAADGGARVAGEGGAEMASPDCAASPFEAGTAGPRRGHSLVMRAAGD